MNHPRLPEARRAYLDSFSKVYGGDPFLVRLLLQAGRFFVFHSAAVLEAAQDLSRRETWFTVAALKQQLAMFGYASPRQIDHLLARLCEVGFIEQSRAAGDGRVRLLATTNKLRSHHTEWLAAHYVPLARLYPDHDYSPVLSRNRAFHVLHCRACLPFTPVGARLMMTLPDTLLFFGHAAGPLIPECAPKGRPRCGRSGRRGPLHRSGRSLRRIPNPRPLLDELRRVGWSRQNRWAWRPKHRNSPAALGELRPRSDCGDVSSRRHQPRRDAPVDEGGYGWWHDCPA